MKITTFLDKFRKKTVVPYKVAILLPAYHSITNSVKDQFILTLRNNIDRTTYVDCFDASNKDTDLKSTFSKTFRNNYDLLFSVGHSATKSAVTYASQLRDSTPIVCCGISRHLFENSVPRNLTGVLGIDTADYASNSIDTMFKLKTDIRNVAFVYDFQSSFQAKYEHSEKVRIIEALRKYNCKITRINSRTFRAGNFRTLLLEAYPAVDLVILARDNRTMLLSQSIINLCNLLGKPLLALDGNTVKQGASIGVETLERDFGREAGLMAHSILSGREVPSEMPLTTPETQFKLLINLQASRRQHLFVDHNHLLLMQHSQVI